MKNQRNFRMQDRVVRAFAATALCGALALASGCDSDAGTTATAATDTASGDTKAGDAAGTDVTGTDVSTDATSTVAFELIGTWATPYGTDDTITQTTWNEAKIVEFDNVANLAFTQEPANDPYNPNKFNKVIWTEPKNSSFYYCIVDYGKDSLDLAKASTMTADASSPDTKGCGGAFPWTKATKK